MANTTVIDNLFNTYIEDNENSKKYYIALGNYFPEIGHLYQCKKIDVYNPNIIKFSLIETSNVIEVKKLSSDIFLISTLNSFYIVKLIDFTPENSHFAIIREHPEIGFPLEIYAFDYLNDEVEFSRLGTSEVVSSKFLNGIYEIKTINSTYYCLPFF